MSREHRRQIAPVALLLCAIVRESPGIHFRGLGRAAHVSSTGQLRHHLDRLGRRGDLVEIEDGRFKRFFVPGDHDARIRHGLARFARRVPHLIGQLLLERAMSRTELRRSLGCADSTLGYHLSRMVALGDLVRTPGRNCCLYSLANPEFVGQLLHRQTVAQGAPDDGTTVPVRDAGPESAGRINGPPPLPAGAEGVAGPLEPPQPPQRPWPFGSPTPRRFFVESPLVAA